MKNKILLYITVLSLPSCTPEKIGYDASGTFEAVETTIAAEASGTVEEFQVDEGQNMVKNTVVGLIDTTSLYLRKKQIAAQLNALYSKLPDIDKQTEYIKLQADVSRSRLSHLRSERERIQSLVRSDAATSKQLDDITAQIDQTKKQITSMEKQYDAQVSVLSTQHSAVKGEIPPLKVQLEQMDDQIQKCQIINKVSGTVLTKYVERYEMVTPGKPLYKIADLSTMTLRAYITGNQLSEVKINQRVKIRMDAPSGENGEFKEYSGRITWISAKAEFSPKAIQTKEERENRVYAIKIDVKNDGMIKIGMYGEALWTE